jgi:hypothetical protein
MQPSFNCFRAFVRTGWFATAALVLCCLTLAVLVGDIGFQGDDWWIFSFPFWSPFPQSLWEYTAAAKRPVEGLYWISLFEVFRFNRVVYYLFSLFLLAGSCLLMRSCLMRSFPGRNAPATMSMLFAFVLPPVSNLIYMIHTDNSRISMVFFWLSVIAFQRWAARSGSWSGLMTPILIYCLSVLTYENTSLLIFSIPFFIWPVFACRFLSSHALLSHAIFSGPQRPGNYEHAFCLCPPAGIQSHLHDTYGQFPHFHGILLAVGDCFSALGSKVGIMVRTDDAHPHLLPVRAYL